MRPVAVAGSIAALLLAVGIAVLLLVSTAKDAAPETVPAHLGGPDDEIVLDDIRSHTEAPPYRPQPTTRPARAAESAAQPQEDADAVAEPPPLPQGTGALFVEVVNADGHALFGVEVSLLAGRSRGWTMTDQGGLAQFVDIAPGSYTVRVRGEDIPSLEAAQPAEVIEGEQATLTFRIDAFDLTISGRILDQDGRPVAGLGVQAQLHLASAQVTDLIPTEEPVVFSTSDDDGNYVVKGLADGDYVVATDGFGGYASTRRVFRAGVQSADLVVSAKRTIVVSGTISDRDGLPIAGASVHAIRGSREAASSAEDGQYRIEIDLDGQSVATLKVSAAGYRDARVNVPVQHDEQLGDDRQVDVHLDALGDTSTVVGLVVDLAGEPIASETVYLYSRTLRTRYQGRSGLDGAFRIDDVQVAGDYKAWVFPKNAYRDWEQQPLSISSETTELLIELADIERGRVTGRLVDPAGSPIPGFDLWLRSQSAQGFSIALRSEDDGSFVVENAPAGPLVFETRSLPRFNIRAGDLRPNGETQVELVLDWGTETVAGMVIDPDGLPVAGARVQLTWTHRKGSTQATSFRDTSTDEEGRFEFGELARGVHRVHVISGQYRGVQIAHNVGVDSEEPTIQLRAKRK